MSMLSVELAEGNVHQYAKGVSIGEIIYNVYGKKSGCVAALVDDCERDLSFTLTESCKIEPIFGDSEAGMFILRHSCAHLLAQAVTE